MPIKFYFEKEIKLKHKRHLKYFIESIFLSEGKPFKSLNYIFCSDVYLLEINKQYLNHDYYTDIITFDLSSDKNSPIIGEIYISVDRVADNANTHNTIIEKELLRVIFHGVLHLCGHKDKTKAQKLTMRSMEDKYIHSYLSQQVPRNTVSR